MSASTALGNEKSMPKDADRPLCQPADLGRPIPPSPHAVSVCLPTWADNVGYEQADPRVIGRMQCGYPRFFLHPSVVRLFQTCEAKFARPGECCFAFPSRRVAERCVEFVRKEKGIKGIIEAVEPHPIFSVRVPVKARDAVKAYWQHTGQIVSSRQAERILAGRPAETDGTVEKQTIRERLAGLMQVDPADVWLFPSGMAAIETAFRAFQRLRPTAKSVQFGFPYVDSLKIQERLGVGVHFFPRGDADELRQLAQTAAGRAALGPLLRVSRKSVIGQPRLATHRRAVAKARFSRAGRRHAWRIDQCRRPSGSRRRLLQPDEVLLRRGRRDGGVADDQFAHDPERNGFATALEAEYEDLLDAEDAAVLEQNSRDCVERVRRINQSAERLCDTLRTHPAVERIEYPKYRTPENYRAYQRPDGGYGGLCSILLRNPETNAPAFFDALAIAKGPNLGTNFSLCCPYTILAHFNELDFVERCGISRYLLRVSVGLEDPDWLIRRFLDALASLPT